LVFSLEAESAFVPAARERCTKPFEPRSAEKHISSQKNRKNVVFHYQTKVVIAAMWKK
jgi:hypothetical protein